MPFFPKKQKFLYLNSQPTDSQSGVIAIKGNPHRASTAMYPLYPIILHIVAASKKLEYIVMLGNGSGTNFQASPHHHR